MKRCYSLTQLTAPVGSPSGTQSFRINSTIWLNNTDFLSNAELNAYAVFLELEIRNVWSSATNPGLSRGNGLVHYNNSNIILTCMPPVGGTAHARDTGVTVGLWSNRIAANPNPELLQNEIRFDVNRLPLPGRRAFMERSSQSGQLYYYAPAPIAPAPVPPYVDNASVHNTIAHEFGHAMGLSDRYHFVTNGSYVNYDASTNDDRNYLANTGGPDIAMFLPGLFDPLAEYNSASFNESDPYYNQGPYNQGPYVNPSYPTVGAPYSGMAPFNLIPVGALPQPNYNSALGGTNPGPYDIEYNHGFAWLHNLYSGSAVNDPFIAAHPFRTGQGPSSLLYQFLYQAEFANPAEVVLITSIQCQVIINFDPSKQGNALSGEIISTMTELEHAKSRGFEERIFDQYMFIAKIANRSNGESNPVAWDPNGLSRQLLKAGASQRFFEGNDATYGGIRAYATFAGIAYKMDLNKDGEGGTIVSDLDFNRGQTALKDNSLGGMGKLGIHDMMSYRMSEFAQTTTKRWSLKDVTGSNEGSIIGFFNPSVAAQRNPKSLTLNQVLDNIVNTRIFGNTIPGGPFNTDATTLVSYGGSMAPFFINRMSAIEGGMAVNVALSGPLKIFRNVSIFSLGEDYDEFKEVGIGTIHARKIWNGYAPEPWFAPRNSRIPAPGIALTWNMGQSNGRLKLEADFNVTLLPNNTGIADKYTLVVPYYRNRRIFMILTNPT